MKIADSGVSMAANHYYESHVSGEKMTMEVNGAKAAKVLNGVAAIYEESGESSIVTAMAKYQKQEKRMEAEQRKAQEIINARMTLSDTHNVMPAMFDFDALNEMKTSILQKMLELLNGTKTLDFDKLGELKKGNALDLRSPAFKAADARSRLFGAGLAPSFKPDFGVKSGINFNAFGAGFSFTFDGVRGGGLDFGTNASGTLWQRITATSVRRSETESTEFQSRGFAVTQDGRAIEFDVGFSMSRAFTQNYDSIQSESFIMTDPLIINLDSDLTSVSDEKFDFDLNADGQKEKISFAGAGSGFLALDKNQNGVIDDGSELFGAKSGDGFADLAAYDDDGNGWIDENDSVYSQLRVWIKDADGHEQLLNLKEADVGAIYLDSANTEFSLNNAATNETNGIMRKTGVYLKESTGKAGTLSHVDLRC